MDEHDYGVHVYEAGRWMRMNPQATLDDYLAQMAAEHGWSEYTAKNVQAAGQLGQTGYLPTGTRKASAPSHPGPQFGPDEMQQSVWWIGDVRKRVA